MPVTARADAGLGKIASASRQKPNMHLFIRNTPAITPPLANANDKDVSPRRASLGTQPNTWTDEPVPARLTEFQHRTDCRQEPAQVGMHVTEALRRGRRP